MSLPDDLAADIQAALANYQEWSQERTTFFARDGHPDGPSSNDWARSDDTGTAGYATLAALLERTLAATTPATNPLPDEATPRGTPLSGTS